jgi:[NiFe] hydrogenase assembly HybE family chaperone
MIEIETLTARFRPIAEEPMKDLPVYNADLDVEAFGFQPLGDQQFGILIAPWFMNALVLPPEHQPMDLNTIGRKVDVELPSGTRSFIWSGDEQLGMFKSLSLHSPMQQFLSQEQARAEARRLVEIFLQPEQEPEPAPAAPAGNDKPALSRRDFLRAKRTNTE